MPYGMANEEGDLIAEGQVMYGRVFKKDTGSKKIYGEYNGRICPINERHPNILRFYNNNPDSR